MKKIVNQLIALYVIMHMAIVAVGQTGTETPDASLDALSRTEMINEILETIKNNYFSVEIAAKMEAGIRQRMARREYDSVTSPKVLAAMLTVHLQEICRDKHVYLQVAESRTEPAPQRSLSKAENFGFRKVEILPGNIGYVRINEFRPPEESAATAGAVMKFVEHTDALIIDLRNHTGGAVPMVAHMVSYFVADKPIQLMTVDIARELKRFESWTVEKLDGPRYADKPVYLVTSRETFSGGEEFAYNLQALKRAKLIGERTKGGANPVRTFMIRNIFRLGVSFAQVKNAITGTNWEGGGVKPDIESTAEKALEVAIDTARNDLQAKTSPVATAKAEIRDSAFSEVSNFPATPSGTALQQFLEAFNSGSREKLIRFHLGRLPDTEEGKRIAEQNSVQDLNFFQTSGGLAARRIVSSSDTKIQLVAQLKQRNEWIILTIEVDRRAPHSIINLNVEPTTPLK